MNDLWELFKYSQKSGGGRSFYVSCRRHMIVHPRRFGSNLYFHWRPGQKQRVLSHLAHEELRLIKVIIKSLARKFAIVWELQVSMSTTQYPPFWIPAAV